MGRADDAKLVQERAERVISHALVELRRHKWWPLGVKSAVLLDLSQTGFKVEFTGQAKCGVDEMFWMQIPLSPFGIVAPRDIAVRVTVKWFDPKKMRMGGIFESPDAATNIFLEKIIEKVKIQTLGL